ncbi:hypothetical protein ABTX15_02490 [Micromonospora sp. NPDC094482]|uniref:hypothetical protein n=1 Tax=unclassified Micromonospora TaxID=2617518 RepID=UPI00332D26A5
MANRNPLAALFLAALLTACSGTASHEEQLDYLREMAQHGAELHAAKKSEGSAGDREECAGAYESIYDGPSGHAAPQVEDYAKRLELLKSGERLFVESCVNGIPSPVTEGTLAVRQGSPLVHTVKPPA